MTYIYIYIYIHIYIYNGILIRHKNNEILSFAATWMDSQIVIPSEVGRAEKSQVSYDTAYMWNLKNVTNERIYKTEIELQT